MFFAVVTVSFLALAVYCLLDLLRTPREQVRGLPKPLWLLLIVLAVPVGTAGWLLVGRPTAGRPAAPPVRPAAPRPPDDDEDFLRGLRRRADEQRKREADERREVDPPTE